MQYIAVRRDAIAEIIAERQLQTTDYDLGSNFVKAVQVGENLRINRRLEVKTTKQGCVIIGEKQNEEHYLVFDVDQMFENRDNVDSTTFLLILQKTLRFAETYWSSGVLKKYEVVNQDRTRGVVFPFPISQQTSKRVVIDLAPDSERMAKRDKAGRYLLVFKFGQGGSNQNEVVSLASFRRFLSALEKVSSDNLVAAPEATPEANIDAFSTTEMDEIANKIDPHQNYEKWLHLLTNTQRDFITKPLNSPRRVDGPAGSGKTVSLALAAIHAMRLAAEDDRDFEALFVTHSEASRRNIKTILQSMDGNLYLGEQPTGRRLQVVTLQGYCASLLRQDLSTTEFVDPDAYDAKQLQGMFVEEAIKKVEAKFSSYEPYLSKNFKEYFLNEDMAFKSALIQHEIAVVIKGRSKESLDVYKEIPPLSSGLPIDSVSDKGFIWTIYEEYRRQLIRGGQFDTDDVILTALSQLSTPIWRRRRDRDGFDALFIDETHLFNMNELSVFHHLTKSDKVFPIAFAVDRSQAIGDQGWDHDIDVGTLLPASESQVRTEKSKLDSIFRSSPEIVNLAFSITSAGASLFTNFDDPMASAHSNMSYEEEKKARTPFFANFANDDEMVKNAFKIAEKMKSDIGSTKGDIVLVASDEMLFRELQKFAHSSNKPIEVLKERGDAELTKRAKEAGRFVVSMPDYVGGLEFDGAVLVGIDEGRVPPQSNSNRDESKAYVTYAAHNKLYVAISRARYQVAILGSLERGRSPILENAFETGALVAE